MKVFGVGLPRTGTRSLLAGLQSLGLKTIHAMHLTGRSYSDADAFSDTPIWSEWNRLADIFPNSKFILTTRDPEKWFLSFKRVLTNCYQALMREPPTLKGPRGVDRRCYADVFHGYPVEREHFLQIFNRHNQAVKQRFKGTRRLITIDVSYPGELKRVADFLKLELTDFPNVNKLAKIGGGRTG